MTTWNTGKVIRKTVPKNILGELTDVLYGCLLATDRQEIPNSEPFSNNKREGLA